MSFGHFVRRATGFEPYPYQQRLADEGLPELLRAPTGSGKTVAAVLPWLYRRRQHPDAAVRSATPHWLVLALPLRTLVDQVEEEIAGWLEGLGLTDDVGLHVLLGGRTGEAKDWTENPGRDAILVGSIDMLVSRALNRGYAASRWHWPIDFGFLNSGAQWVFDEVQLMGPALPTTRQLQALREAFGTTLPTRSMWMSATIAEEWLSTVDAPEVTSAIEISNADRTGPLGKRTSATRRVAELIEVDPGKPASIAETVAEEHRAGTRTICIFNKVATARDVYKRLEKLTEADVVLVHSRFRPKDRAAATYRALEENIPDVGRIVVSTQAIEAGVDITSETLITEAAPWTSIVQRAGRCNRYGESNTARLLWYKPAKPEPYETADVERSIEALRELEGVGVTGEGLGGRADEERPIMPVLRRRDVVELFDTTPTVTGDDIDISPYIRDDTDRDVFVGWAELDDVPDRHLVLSQDDLCRVPIGEFRKWHKRLGSGKNRNRIWRFDPVAGRWAAVRDSDLRPGRTFLAAANSGGYDLATGWDTAVTKPVPVVEREGSSDIGLAIDRAVGSDDRSHIGEWVTLADHLSDTEREAERLVAVLAPHIGERWRSAVVTAAALHDIGKAHPVFQETMRNSAGPDEGPLPDRLWAKSSRGTRASHARQGFRHELVSAMLLRRPESSRLLGDDPDLVVYLVAAHHGRVRLAIPTADDAATDTPTGSVLGVRSGDVVPAIALHARGQIAETILSTGGLADLGGPDSWVRLSLSLRDRADLGPFRLAWMEAAVRLADWRASANPGRVVDVPKGVVA